MTQYILSALHVKRCGHRPPWMTADPGKESTATLHSHVPDVPNVPDLLPRHPVQPPQLNNPCMEPFTSSWCPSWHPATSSHGLDTHIWFTSPTHRRLFGVDSSVFLATDEFPCESGFALLQWVYKVKNTLW